MSAVSSEEMKWLIYNSLDLFKGCAATDAEINTVFIYSVSSAVNSLYSTWS